mmetsp:Transcript_18463/g.55714  ORF Transcript_18463/g.55714 Transcript_18463/m.55714 type:complete len:214 (-) Transcript_18463:588-1229(-)
MPHMHGFWRLWPTRTAKRSRSSSSRCSCRHLHNSLSTMTVGPSHRGRTCAAAAVARTPAVAATAAWPPNRRSRGSPSLLGRGGSLPGSRRPCSSWRHSSRASLLDGTLCGARLGRCVRATPRVVGSDHSGTDPSSQQEECRMALGDPPSCALQNPSCSDRKAGDSCWTPGPWTPVPSGLAASHKSSCCRTPTCCTSPNRGIGHVCSAKWKAVP